MKFSSFVRKAVACVVLAAGVALGSSAATTSVVRYLETYDQLHNFVGQDGLFYVREAGAYPHGDPTVRTGWAMYTWDAQKTAWNKVTCEDLMALAVSNPNDFLTKRLYAADIAPFKAKVNTWGAAIASNVQAVAEIKADNIVINGRLDTAEKKMGIQGDYIKDLRNRVKVLEDGTPVIEASIQELQELTAALGVKIEAQAQNLQTLSNKVVTVDSKIDVTKTAVMAYTDVKVADLNADISQAQSDATQALADAASAAAAAGEAQSTADTAQTTANNAKSTADGVAAKIDVEKVSTAIATAKSEAILAAGEAADAKISAKTGNILGTIKGYVDAKEVSANGYTDNSVKALTNETGVINTRIKALADGAVATAQAAAEAADAKAVAAATLAASADGKASTAQSTANAADAKAVAAQADASSALVAADNAQTAADDAATTASTADGKATAAKTAADANSAKLAGIDTTVSAAIATAKSEAVTAAGSAADTKVATAKTEVLTAVAGSEAALSNNVIKIASDDATTKASTAKEEAVALSAYAWDESSPADKVIEGITFKNWQIKNKTQLTVQTAEQKIAFTLPPATDVKTVQRAAAVYLDYTGTTAPTLAIAKDASQTTLEGESGNYSISDISTGKWLIYFLEVSKNVFWIQVEKFQ